jgi:hypothetical protein
MQLLKIMKRYDMPVIKADRPAQVGRAIAESLYMNAARRGGRDIYETLADGRTVSVHPGSLLAPFDKDDWAELVVCLEMVMAQQVAARNPSPSPLFRGCRALNTSTSPLYRGYHALNFKTGIGKVCVHDASQGGDGPFKH